jgi:pimeloyl-ACP methyl ester carboxylesterase
MILIERPERRALQMARARLNGVEIYFETSGRGEPVVLLNGVLMTTASWAAMRPCLEGRFLCVLHDLRGQLLSDKGDTGWSMEQHVDDLAALLDHLEIDSCHLVGTSYGGEVGLLFAAAFPERTRSLSVIASVSEVGPGLALKVGAWLDASRHGPEAMLRAVAADSYSEAFLRAHPDLVETAAARLAGAPDDFFQGFERLIGAFLGLDATERLSSIRAPTLLVAAEHDTLKPPGTCRQMAQAIPGSEMVLIPDAGHAVVIERPEPVCSAVLGFLMKHSAGAERE